MAAPSSSPDPAPKSADDTLGDTGNILYDRKKRDAEKLWRTEASRTYQELLDYYKKYSYSLDTDGTPEQKSAEQKPQIISNITAKADALRTRLDALSEQLRLAGSAVNPNLIEEQRVLLNHYKAQINLATPQDHGKYAGFLDNIGNRLDTLEKDIPAITDADITNINDEITRVGRGIIHEPEFVEPPPTITPEQPSEFDFFLKKAEEHFGGPADFPEKKLISKAHKKKAMSGTELAAIFENRDKFEAAVDFYKDVEDKEIGTGELDEILKYAKTYSDIFKYTKEDGSKGVIFSDDDVKKIKEDHVKKPFKAADIANMLNNKVDFHKLYQKYTNKDHIEHFDDNGNIVPEPELTDDEFEQLWEAAKRYSGEVDSYNSKGKKVAELLTKKDKERLAKMSPRKGSNLARLLKNRIDNAHLVKDAENQSLMPGMTYIKHSLWSKTEFGKEPLKTGLPILDKFLEFTDPLFNLLIDFGIPQAALLGPLGFLISPKAIGAIVAIVKNRRVKYDKNLKAGATMSQFMNWAAYYGLVDESAEVPNPDLELAQKMGLPKLSFAALSKAMPQVKENGDKDPTPINPKDMKNWVKACLLYLDSQPKMAEMMSDKNAYKNVLNQMKDKALMDSPKRLKKDADILYYFSNNVISYAKDKKHKPIRGARGMTNATKHKHTHNVIDYEAGKADEFIEELIRTEKAQNVA